MDATAALAFGRNSGPIGEKERPVRTVTWQSCPICALLYGGPFFNGRGNIPHLGFLIWDVLSVDRVWNTACEAAANASIVRELFGAFLRLFVCSVAFSSSNEVLSNDRFVDTQRFVERLLGFASCFRSVLSASRLVYVGREREMRRRGPKGSDKHASVNHAPAFNNLIKKKKRSIRCR